MDSHTMNIDPRVNWVSIVTVPFPKWECIDIKYSDPQEAKGDRNIYVALYGADGTGEAGKKVWLDTGVPDDMGFQVTKGNGACDFPQTGDSSFDPNRGERGPYAVFVDGEPSDRVEGMGLPLKQHVTYSVKFKWSVGSSPPQPGGELTEARVREIVREETLARWA